jgi:hypothetical protein
VGLHPNALRALAPRGPTCTALQLIAYRDRAVSPTEVTGKKTPGERYVQADQYL